MIRMGRFFGDYLRTSYNNNRLPPTYKAAYSSASRLWWPYSLGGAVFFQVQEMAYLVAGVVLVTDNNDFVHPDAVYFVYIM